jgi:hypothetical protein
MLRCAKTLTKKFIGIFYERHTYNPDDSTINQGLIGRNTGYDVENFSICYTNIKSIEKYEKLWKSGFEDRTIKWNSKTTKYNKKKGLDSTGTFNEKISDINSLDNNEKEPVIKKFKNFEELKKYLKEVRGSDAEKTFELNNYGFYESKIRKITKVYSCAEIRSNRRQGLTNNNHRYNPCYRDINNKNTLEWWLIYYER